METKSRNSYRIGVIILTIITGLLLTWAISLADSGPNFEGSYKTGPQYAFENQVFTYTIVAVNTGDYVEGVVLSDTLPDFVTYVPGSCTYIRPQGTAQLCGPFNHLWERTLDTGDRITTTFAVTPTAGSMGWPCVNHAYLSANLSGRQGNIDSNSILNSKYIFTMTYEITLNPYYLYLPVVARNYSP